MQKNNLVRDMRMAHGMTIEAFAQSIGVSKSTVTTSEAGQPTAAMKAKVLKVYELDDTFFHYVEQRKKTEGYE